MNFKDTAGIDVSKLTIDVTIYVKNVHKTFENNDKGFRSLLKWMKLLDPNYSEQILFCLEHTGIYSYPISYFFAEQEISYCVIPSLEIKRSMGMVRGKDDKIDSKRIAKYAFLRKDELTLTTMPIRQIDQLRNLLTLRERMVNQRAGYKASLKEYKLMLKKKDNKLLFHAQETIIRNLTKQILQIEKEIRQVISSDIEMKRVFTLVSSVRGIGLVLAVNLLVKTHCFTRFDDSRKFACYAGIAPFEQQSGTSLKKKSKVNHMADKRMKSLLNLASMVAIQYDPEMKSYYERRVKQGKSKMSTINIIRNKLVHRVFAVVKRGTPYVTLQNHAA